ncbi:MAG: helix-turn-helix domain-containing protein [Elusimicrobiales bacterium]
MAEPVERKAYKIREVAKMLGISQNHAYNLIQRGALPAVKVGRVWRVPKAAVDDMLKRGGS